MRSDKAAILIRTSATLILAGLLASFTVPAFAVTPLVVDSADALTSSQEADLAEKFSADGDESGLVFVAETITTLDGQSISDYAKARGDELGIGDDSGNGVFFVIAQEEREVRIQLGTGVTGTISDARAQKIVDENMVPYLSSDDYFNALVAGADAVDEFYQSAGAGVETEEGFAWGTFWKWTLIVVGTLVALFILFVVVVGTRYILEGQRRTREHELAEKRSLFIRDMAGKFWYSSDRPAFIAAESEDARRAILEPWLAEYLVKDSGFATEAHTAFFEKFLRFEHSDIEDDLGFKLSVWPYFPSHSEKSIQKALKEHRTYALEVQAERKQKEEKRRVDREKSLKRAAAAKAEKDAKDEADRQAAKQLWESFSDDEKAELRAAKTKKDKVKVLDSHTTSFVDASLMFPVIYGLYATEIGTPQAEVTHSTSSSFSSSSSHSSDSSSYSSSFDGGSFSDGGASSTF